MDIDYCKKKLKRLKIVTNKTENRKLKTFQVFLDSAHEVQVEHHQGHVQLDKKNPYHGAHGRLIFDSHHKKWILHIGIILVSIIGYLVLE